MKRRTALALAGAGVFGTHRAAVAQVVGLKLRIGAGASDQVTPLLYAERGGLFKTAGLDVELLKINRGAEVAAAVTGGSLDIGMANVVSLITAHARGIPFVMIAPTTLYKADYHPDSAVIVAATSAIFAPRDLAGKTVSVVSLQDIFSLGLLAWLEQGGVDAQGVRFVEIPPASAPAALEAGRIDAAVVFQPVMQDATQSGKFRSLTHPMDALGKQLQVAVWFTTADWATAHRDLVERFVRVMYDASGYVAKHENESAPLLAAYAGVDTETVLRVPRPARGLYLDARDIQPFVDAAARYKYIAKSFPVQEMISTFALKPGR